VVNKIVKSLAPLCLNSIAIRTTSSKTMGIVPNMISLATPVQSTSTAVRNGFLSWTWAGLLILAVVLD
jgi:hypothetical protein